MGETRVTLSVEKSVVTVKLGIDTPNGVLYSGRWNEKDGYTPDENESEFREAFDNLISRFRDKRKLPPITT